MLVSLFFEWWFIGYVLKVLAYVLGVCGLEGMFCSGDGSSYVSDGYVGRTESQYSMT
jgi:hypothetical protein